MSHSQDPEGGANFAAKLLSGTVLVKTPDDGATVIFAVLLVPGLGDWQATQVLSVDLLVSIQVSKLVSALTAFNGVMQVSQDQDPAAGANFCIKSLFVGAGFLGGAGLPVEGLDD